MTSGWRENPLVDNRIPVLAGESQRDFVRYKRLVQAAVLSASEDEKKTLGPRLYKNLLGLNSSISLLIEQEDPK